MKKNSKIYVAGHNGLVGSAIVRKLKASGYKNIVFRDSRDLDLRDARDVSQYFAAVRPDYVFLAAAKVGGVHANNTYRAEFIYDNLAIQTNVIHAAYKYGVKKLLFLGSNCLYPKLVAQPIREEYLLSGKLEPTTEAYAIAKIAGIKMCEAYRTQYGCNFISVLPVNLYGPNDNYDLETSHVMPALIKKFYDAKKGKKPYVKIWGSGIARREFLHVDDVSDACLFLMLHYNDLEPINVGSGSEISIKELAFLIKDVSGFKGGIKFETSKPDGILSKLLDSKKLYDMGWRPEIWLREGIEDTYKNFLKK